MIQPLHQIGQILPRCVRTLGQEPLQHLMSKPVSRGVRAFSLQRSPGIDSGAIGVKEARRQPRPIIDCLQPQGTGIMDHQPGPCMRCTGQLSHPMLEQGHLTPRHCPQKQRSCQDTASIQTGDELRQIRMVRGLVHQIDRGALASEGGKVGITGFCFGGMITWRAAHHGLGLACGSGFYGGGIPNYMGLKPTIPLMMHYGDRDTGIPNEQVADLKAAHPGVEVFMYPAEHGFCNADRPERFDRAACELATARTLEHFGKYLG